MKVTGIGPANSFVCRFIDLMNPEGAVRAYSSCMASDQPKPIVTVLVIDCACQLILQM